MMLQLLLQESPAYPRRTTLLLLVAAATRGGLPGAWAIEPNPPSTWGPNTHVFSPKDPPDQIQSKIDEAFYYNGGHTTGNSPPGEFSENRYAFLFRPGVYSTEIPVGYYTTVAGLGRSPDDVVFGRGGGKGVYCEEGSWLYSVGSLDTFWRSVENFRSEANHRWFGGAQGTLWSVSQAAPMRRLHITEDLYLFQYKEGDCNGQPCQGPHGAAGYASGGFTANVKVDKAIKAGGQQQWLARNVGMKSWHNGAWSIVSVGCEGGPPSSCSPHGGPQFTTVKETPAVAEKPYIIEHPTNPAQFLLIRPGMKCNSQGPSWGAFATAPYYEGSRSWSRSGAAVEPASGDMESSFIQIKHSADSAENSTVASADHAGCVESGDTYIDFTRVYVAVAERDTAASINWKLASRDVDALVLTAGIYHLENELVIRKSHFVVLGLGLATLVSSAGKPAIRVEPYLRNVRLASVLLQASSVRSPTLLDWGAHGDTCQGCVISDLFARTGGPDGNAEEPAWVDTFVHLRSSGIIGDNLWLWRADHTHQGAATHPDVNPCATGLIVDGDDVTMYSLAVEHTLKDLTVWNGERGRTYFYQSELPYGVGQWWGGMNYVGYRVSDHVREHKAYGVGVYHYFRDNAVMTHTGIRCPSHLVNSFVAPFAVYLSGKGSMQHVINELGAATYNLGKGATVAFTCLGSMDGLPAGSVPVARVPTALSPDYTPKGLREEELEDFSQLQSPMDREL